MSEGDVEVLLAPQDQEGEGEPSKLPVVVLERDELIMAMNAESGAAGRSNSGSTRSGLVRNSTGGYFSTRGKLKLRGGRESTIGLSTAPEGVEGTSEAAEEGTTPEESAEAPAAAGTLQASEKEGPAGKGDGGHLFQLYVSLSDACSNVGTPLACTSLSRTKRFPGAERMTSTPF